MTETVKKYLADIQEAIGAIEEFMVGISHFFEYQKDRKTKSAVERQLAIIGEAINQLKKHENAPTIDQALKIISLRNRLVHAYDSVDDSMIWLIISKYLPLLKQEIEELLKEK